MITRLRVPTEPRSPQIRALQALCRTHDADQAARFALPNGSIRVTLWHTKDRDPVCVAEIDQAGHVHQVAA